MKKISIYMMALLAGGFAMSCANNELDNIKPEGPQTAEGNFRISATIDELNRTSVDEEGKINWNTEDKISVWLDGGSSNAPLSWSESAEGATVATFSGDVTEPEAESYDFYAVYPYAESYGDNVESVALTIPATVSQAKTINEMVGVSDFMLAHKTLTKGEEYKTTFAHPLALVNIVVDGSTSIWSDGVIEKMTINAPVSIVGDVTANLKEGTIAPVDAAAGKTLTVNFGPDAKMNAPQNAWVAINPVQMDDTNWEFVLLLTNGQQITFYIAPKQLQAQTQYTFTFNQIEKWIARKDNNSDVTTGYAAAKSYDLVADGGRANCYIIPNGGMYKFACDRPLQSNTSFTLSGITAADWLWATGEQSATSFTEADVPVYNVSMSGSNIFFRVKPNAKGNVIVAATNASGEIVWSWHLWVTPEDPREDPTHWTRGEAWQLMDRNLGALSNDQGDVNSYGLYYQWGRKDPFPGSNKVGTATSTKESASFGDGTAKYVINSKFSSHTFKSIRNANTKNVGDVAYSIAHPTENIHCYNASGTTGKSQTWLYTTAVEDALKLWNSDHTNRYAKTVYDPCPAGYCVPIHNEHSWRGTYFTNYVTFESTLSGMIYNRDASNKTYLPAAGYRSSGQLNGVGYGGYYWNANINVAYSTDSNFRAYVLAGYNRETLNTGNLWRTEFACPVRCMKQ